MKKWLVCLIGSLAVASLNAAELDWLTSLPAAKAKAKTEHKLIFVEFTGSDWCPPCKKLHSEVLTSDAFAKYASDKFVLVELDFPRRKEQSEELKKANQALAKEFGLRGYPTVVVLDADGKELHRKVGYGGQSAKDYIANLDEGIGK